MDTLKVFIAVGSVLAAFWLLDFVVLDGQLFKSILLITRGWA